MMICVGIGPGDPDYLTVRARNLIQAAEVLAGFTTVVDLVRHLAPPGCRFITMDYRNQTAQLAATAALHQAGKRCVVAFMGDVHFSGFQFLERVEHACGAPVETVPGISSAQILAARTRVCFDETTFLTFHRRGDLEPFKRHLIHVLQDGRNAIVIPLPWDFMPKHICRYCLDHGIDGDHPVEVWERLTQGEAAWRGRLEDCVADFSDLSILLIRTRHPLASQLEDL